MENNQKTYAHILEGKVVNVSLWESLPAVETNEELVEVSEGSNAGIDWDYVNGKFIDNRPVTQLIGK
jgi:hypothetical protein